VGGELPNSWLPLRCRGCDKEEPLRTWEARTELRGSCVAEAGAVAVVMSIIFGDFEEDRSCHESKVELPPVVAGSPLQKLCFRIYFIDLVGHGQCKSEWTRSSVTKADALANVKKLLPDQGVGFVCCFPHICKVFQFCGGQETTLLGRAYDPLAGFTVRCWMPPSSGSSSRSSVVTLHAWLVHAGG
jgi:hypothetical protein